MKLDGLQRYHKINILYQEAFLKLYGHPINVEYKNGFVVITFPDDPFYRSKSRIGRFEKMYEILRQRIEQRKERVR